MKIYSFISQLCEEISFYFVCATVFFSSSEFYYYNDVNIYMYIYKMFYDVKASFELFRGICAFGGETKKGRRGKTETRTAT